MSAAIPKSSKILRLPQARHSPADRRATQVAAKLRIDLSLLQGYADIMEGLSPKQTAQILRVMAQKMRELSATLQPFLEQEKGRRSLTEYRQVRDRTRALVADYRLLLRRLHDTVRDGGSAAQEG